MDYSKIAIFRALHLGDMLCIIPAVRAIRSAYPKAEITLVGLPWQKDFVARFPAYFDRFIAFPGWPGLPEQEPDGDHIIAFLRDVRKCQFDLVCQMHGNGVITNTLCMLWGAKKVCGLRKNGEFAPDETLFPVSEDGEHEILRFLKLVDSLGIPRQGTHLQFPINDDDDKTLRSMMTKSGLKPQQYICVHPGARDPRRRWPIENFAYVANQIATHGYPLVLTGSEAEKSLMNELQQQIRGPVINIVESFGHLTAGELACVLKHTRLLISNDTGVSHIAAALKVHSVILFSPYSDFARWRPLDEAMHTAIPYEKTRNVEYVLTCVTNKLAEADKEECKRTLSPA